MPNSAGAGVPVQPVAVKKVAVTGTSLGGALQPQVPFSVRTKVPLIDEPESWSDVPLESQLTGERNVKLRWRGIGTQGTGMHQIGAGAAATAASTAAGATIGIAEQVSIMRKQMTAL